MATFHEDYVPEEDVVSILVRRNSGRSSGESFVYAPWHRVKLGDYDPIYLLELEAGTRLYKGFQKPQACQLVEDPAGNCGVRGCAGPRWYGDFLTAFQYANRDRKQLFVFEAIKPIVLLNVLDKRNVLVLLNILMDEYFEIGRKEGLTDEERRLLRAPLIDSDRVITAFTGFKTLAENIKLHPEYKPAEHAELEARFGPQTELNRALSTYSEYDFARVVEDTLKLGGISGIHGYYCPIYQSKGQNLSSGVRNAFHREVCLFNARGLVRHVKDAPDDGCVHQAKARGGTRKSLRNKKVDRKPRRTHRKNR